MSERIRKKVGAVEYMGMPPERRPAMETVNASALYADFVRHRMSAPDEVVAAANSQINEGLLSGAVAYWEEFQGRLRLHIRRPGREELKADNW
jgi:hypothetical protein